MVLQDAVIVPAQNFRIGDATCRASLDRKPFRATLQLPGWAGAVLSHGECGSEFSPMIGSAGGAATDSGCGGLDRAQAGIGFSVI